MTCPAPAAREGGRTRWSVFALVYGAGVLVSFQIGKAPAALPLLRAELGLDLVAAGWVVSVFSLLAGLGGALAGIGGDVLGHRRVVLAGVAITAVGSAAGALANGPVLLLATRFLEGIGFILVASAVPGIVVRAVGPADLRIALSTWSTYLPAGMAIMLLLSPVLMAAAGWRGLWLANAALLLVALPALAYGTREYASPPSRRAAPWAGLARAVSAPGPLALAGAFAAYTFQWFPTLAFLPLLLVERLGAGPGMATAGTALVVGLTAVGNLVGGVLLGRGVPRWCIVAFGSAVLGTLSFLVYADVLAAAPRVAVAAVLGLVAGTIPAALIAGTPVHAPGPALIGATNGFLMQGSQLGQMLGPPVVAALVTWTGRWSVAPWPILGGSLVAVGFGLWLRRLERADGPPS